MWSRILAAVLVVLASADVELHWNGGATDELRVIVKWKDRILFDRSFDIIKN